MYASSSEFHQTRDLVIYRDLWTTVHPSPFVCHPPPPRRSYWLYPFPLSTPCASLALPYEMNLQLSILLDFYRPHTGIEPHLAEEVDWALSKSIWLESFADRHVFSISWRIEFYRFANFNVNFCYRIQKAWKSLDIFSRTKHKDMCILKSSNYFNVKALFYSNKYCIKN